MSASRPQRRFFGAATGDTSSASALVSVRAGSASAICCLLLLAVSHEIGAEDCEQSHELFPVGNGKSHQNLLHHRLQTLAQAIEFLAALVGQVEPPSTPI